MAILNIDTAALSRYLTKFYFNKLQINMFIKYLEETDKLVEEGIKAGWINCDDYIEYVQKFAEKEHMTAEDIKNYYCLTAKIIVNSKTNCIRIPDQSYLHYVGMSELAYDIYRHLAPFNHCRAAK